MLKKSKTSLVPLIISSNKLGFLSGVGLEFLPKITKYAADNPNQARERKCQWRATANWEETSDDSGDCEPAVEQAAE